MQRKYKFIPILPNIAIMLFLGIISFGRCYNPQTDNDIKKTADIQKIVFSLNGEHQLELNPKKLESKYFSDLFMTGLKELDSITFENYDNLLIPAEIKKLENLKKLYLNSNKLEMFPDEIFELTSLEELYLNSNKLETITENIKKLDKLKVLDLSNNQIENLPVEMGNLGNLEHLICDLKNVLNMPIGISELTKLEVLVLHTYGSDSIPSEIVNFKYLKSCFLVGNKLKHFPSELKQLEHLKEIWVRGTKGLAEIYGLEYFKKGFNGNNAKKMNRAGVPFHYNDDEIVRGENLATFLDEVNNINEYNSQFAPSASNTINTSQNTNPPEIQPNPTCGDYKPIESESSGMSIFGSIILVLVVLIVAIAVLYAGYFFIFK